jgi:hypothetical protein
MKYIMAQHTKMTAKEMADIIQADDVNVSIFCQANGISPVPRKGFGKKVKDTFHAIPETRKNRMKRIGYNAQKKTA